MNQIAVYVADAQQNRCFQPILGSFDFLTWEFSKRQLCLTKRESCGGLRYIATIHFAAVIVFLEPNVLISADSYFRRDYK